MEWNPDFQFPDCLFAYASYYGKQDAFKQQCIEDPQFCKYMARGGYFRFIPKECITYELCVQCINAYKDGGVLKHVPTELITPELCALAVSKHWYDLEHVPDALKTSELCISAVRVDGRALQYVPDELKTKELCAVVANPDYYYVSQFIPPAYRKTNWFGFPIINNR